MTAPERQRIKRDSAGNLYVATMVGVSGPMQLMLLKYDSGGALQWNKSFPGLALHPPVQLELDPAGNPHVAIRTFGVIKFDTQGNQLWSVPFTAGNLWDMTLDASGNVYVVGSGDNLFVEKYGPNGNLTWSRSAGVDSPNGGAIGMDAAGNVYAGTVRFSGTGSVGGSGYALVKFNAGGAQQWSRTFGESLPWRLDRAQLVVSPGGDVYATGDTGTGGFSPGSTHPNVITVKYNTSGTKLWERIFNGGDDDYPNDMTIDGAGNVYVSANRLNVSVWEQVTIKYSSGGSQLWTRTQSNFSVALSKGQMQTDASGSVYILGAESNVGMRTIKYDANGALQWETRTPETFAGGLVLGAPGDFYLAGARSAAPRDIVTIRFSETTEDRPELYIATLSGPNRIFNGDSFTINTKACNIGTLPASFAVGLYLSTDGAITTSDTRIGERSVSNLAAGACDTSGSTITGTVGLPVGSYVLGAIADDLQQVTEADERNNARTGPATALKEPGPDLTPEVLQANFRGQAGAQFSFLALLRNDGSAGAGPSRSGIYLSTDAQVTTSDRLVYSEVTPGIPVGQLTVVPSTQAFTMPGDFPKGNYYIGIIADIDNVIAEGDETNNIAVWQIPVAITGPSGTATADLATVVSPSLVPFAGGGGWVWHWIGVTNWGPDAASAVNMTETVTSTGSFTMWSGYVSTPADWSCSVTSNQLNCNRQSPQPAGTTDWIGQWIYVPAGNSGSEIRGSATVSTTATDSYAPNNTASGQVTVP